MLFSYSSGLQRRSLPNPFAALQQQSGIKKAANTHRHTHSDKITRARTLALAFYILWNVVMACSP